MLFELWDFIFVRLFFLYVSERFTWLRHTVIEIILQERIYQFNWRTAVSFLFFVLKPK